MCDKAGSGKSTLMRALYHSTETEDLLGNRPEIYLYSQQISFSGDHEQGIAFLEGLAATKNIKIVVSSRPIPGCFEAFATKPKLYLQDFTMPDINKYIRGKTQIHFQFSQISDQRPEEGKALIQQLIDKASGVFMGRFGMPVRSRRPQRF